MQEVFEKIKKNLVTELTFCSGYPNCSEYDYAYEVAMYDARNKATAIVNQVAEEYKDSEIYQLAMIYAEKIMKYGLDITKRWETATSQSAALERAYMRGMQEQIDKFNQLKEEYNNGWIPVEEKTPDDGDCRFYMCIVENHEEDEPMLCQYEEECGFGFCHDIYDENTLGFVDSEFYTNEELGYEKVIAWQQIPKYQPKGDKE